MIDAAPALFRTLEKPHGARSMDTVALAAASAFAAIAHPGLRQQEDLTRLVLSSWPLVSAAARGQVGRILGAMDTVPATVKALVAAETAQVPAAPASMLGLVRRTQLRVADAGASACPSAPPAVQAVAQAALRGDIPRAHALLAEAYGTPSGLGESLAADPAGNLLAKALKGLHAGPGDAIGLLIMLRPQVSADLEALDAWAATYRSLNADECRRQLRSGRGRNAGFGLLREPSADAPARSQFGRRAVRPDGPAGSAGGWTGQPASTSVR